MVVALGYSLPVQHVASRSAAFRQSPEELFAVISDVARFAEWRGDVTSVEVLSTAPLRWREHGGNDDITYVVAESSPPARLVTRIDDPSLPFGGTWTYQLAAGASGTTLTITEHGEVYNPIFRVMSRYVFGHTATIEAYLAALQKRMG
jgi:uncharacterized protein YndB with AHSA1/START domain